MALARYTYLAWLRRGAANSILAPATAKSRAEIKVSLALSDGSVTGAPIEKVFELLGPGDIVGINADQIVRTEPRHWVTDFEPNYFPFIDFYDEDFPWRHTPAPVDGGTHRLIPWLSLLVLAKGEYDVHSAPGRPLPTLVVKPPNLASFFPPADQLWAWAHVQVTGDAGGTRTPDLDALRTRIDGLPDGSVSRIVSPRRLLPKTAYEAFLVPTFEAGRKAGLAIPFDDSSSGTALSWSSGANEFPVYYQWSFSTSEGGDFEDLVERIIPRPVDKRVGVRDMDIAAPGFGMPQVGEAVGSGDPPSHHRGVVGLEGALKAPDMQPKPLDPTSDFPSDAAVIVNLPADAQQSGASDPVVAPPLMGGWHALLDRVDPARRPDWVDDLNLDPRFRAAGGLGGRVVRSNDERYMKLAWEQVGEILAANRKATSLRFAQEAMHRSFVRSIAPLAPEAMLTLSAPMFARVRGSPQTIRGLLGDSRLPDAAMSFAFRKLVRPRGPVARRAFPAVDRRRAAGRLAAALNEGLVSAAPPPPAPAGPTLDQIADAASKGQENALSLARWAWWLVALLVILALLMLLLVGGLAGTSLAALLALGAIGMGVAGTRAREKQRSLEAMRIGSLSPEMVAAAPPPDFAVAAAGEQPAAADPAAAARFGEALREFAGFIAARPAPVPARPRFDLSNAHRKMLAAIAPAAAYPRRAASLIRIGDRSIIDHWADVIGGANGGNPPPKPSEPSIRPVMAYPDIKEPMYRPLSDLGDDLLTPNLGLIPPNTVTLMLTNPPFIEAYMAGVNHEFARELLWREYPTDSRGTPFRQFWDVSRVMTPGVVDPERARRLKDIRAMHEWPVAGLLGTNDNPARGFSGEQVVLALRGDLLKRYPNTIVYAQRARWSTDPDHRDELAVYDEEGSKALAGIDDANIEYPIFMAPVAPDLTFVGFKLKLDEVRGDPALDETAEARATIAADKLGWFFVLQEAIGEPRFGLDEHAPPSTSASSILWDNLSWDHLNMTNRLTVDLSLPFVTSPPGSQPSEPLRWSPAGGATAADLAAILYQKPVMVAWHARQMLEKAKVEHA